MATFKTKANKTLPVSHHCGMLLLEITASKWPRCFPYDSPHSNMQLLPTFPALYIPRGQGHLTIKKPDWCSSSWRSNLTFCILFWPLSALWETVYSDISTPNCVLRAMNFLPISFLTLIIGKGFSVLLVKSCEHTPVKLFLSMLRPLTFFTYEDCSGVLASADTVDPACTKESLQSFACVCWSYWTKWTPILCD